MTDPPGSVGWPVVGDQSLDFNNDAVNFVDTYIQQYKSRVFAGRLLNKPSIFVCSNRGVRQVLSDKTGTFDHGYKPLMEQTFGDNILFYNDAEADVLREKFAHLFSPEALQSYQGTIDSIVEFHVSRINPKKLLSLYHFFKKVVTEVTLSLFLGLDFATQPAEASEVVQHTTAHWKGMTSVPVKIKLPGSCFESCFCKAMVAKKELLSVISNQRGKAASSFLRRMEDLASEEDGDFLNNHLLLFSSAILPKALSSLLTTFAIEMGRPQMVSKQAELLGNEELMHNVFREVERLCPPFLGGRRLAKKDTVVDGYRVPAGYSVLYMTHAAHRDPSVFSSPEVFRPDRWNDTKALSDDNLFVFGQGRRKCQGEHLTRYIMQSIVRHLLQCYHWVLPERQDLSLKYMPVSRPKHPIHVRLLPQQGDTVSLSSTASASSHDTSYDSENSPPDSIAPCCQCQCGTVDVTGHSRQCQCYTGE